MIVKGLLDEDFVNYRLPAMFIASAYCDWKCCNECGKSISMCQNSSLSQSKTTKIPADEIFRRYHSNSITHAVVIGGLEPMLQFDEILEVIKYFRKHNVNDVFVIYTGYYPYEILDKIEQLKHYMNIIVKYGRYIPDDLKHYDEILGVWLASRNQYAEKIS